MSDHEEHVRARARLSERVSERGSEPHRPPAPFIDTAIAPAAQQRHVRSGGECADASEWQQVSEPAPPPSYCPFGALPALRTGDANALHGGLVHQLRVPQARPACPGNRHMPGRARAAAPAQWAAPMVGGSDCGWQQAAGTRGGQSHHGGENARALGGFWSPPRLVVAAGWRWLESTPIRSGPTGPRVHQGG